jgi:hypothetical protein
MFKHTGRPGLSFGHLYPAISLAFAGLACSGGNPSGTPSPRVAADDIVVVITNATEQRVRMYSRFDEGESRRLGEVASNRSRPFVVTRSGSELQLGVIRASAERSRDPRWSNAVAVMAGDSVDCRLDPTGPNSVGLTVSKTARRGK